MAPDEVPPSTRATDRRALASARASGRHAEPEPVDETADQSVGRHAEPEPVDETADQSVGRTREPEAADPAAQSVGGTPEPEAADPADPTAGTVPGTARLGFGLASGDVLPIIMLLAGAASAVSGQKPTGNAVADLVLSAGFGIGVVWLSQYATADAMLMSAVLALFFTGLQMPGALVAAVAVAATLFTTSWARLDRDSTAIAVGLAALFTSQAVLNLPDVRYAGTASLLAAVAVAPIAVTAARAVPAALRSRAIRIAAGAAAVIVVAGAMALYAALSVRNHIEVGIDQAHDGIAALEAGDQPTALALLEASEQNFDIAGDRLGGPLTWAARWIPIAAQHSRALETAADQGSALARTAARTVRSADVDQIRGQNGAIDLDLVDRVNVELQSANLVLRSAQRALAAVRTPWLIPPLASRLDSVQVELASTNEDIDLANQATSVMPAILGAEGPRRYLILFVQPSESREFGGFVGAYGLLEADQGRLTLAESGAIYPDIGAGEATFADPELFPAPYLTALPHMNPQNLTAVPDLTTIARAARELVPQWRSDPDFTIDGVATIDPYALAGLLELTGPIAIPGRDAPIDASNVVDFLLRDQYLEFDQSRDDRQDILNVLAGAAFARLLDIELPGPERLGEIFGPIARADRIGFVTFDGAENAFLERVLLGADLPVVGQAVEMLGVYWSTGTASKIDAYTTRSINYVVDVDPATGEVDGRMDVAFTNSAPADAPEYVLGLTDRSFSLEEGRSLPLGDNVILATVYSRSEISEMTSDAEITSEQPTEPALSYQRHALAVEVPLGETVHVTFDTHSTVEPGRYDLLIPAQQTAIIGDLTVTVRPTPGWVVSGADVAADGSWTSTATLDSSRAFTVRFERAG